jgi:hypothetical protein
MPYFLRVLAQAYAGIGQVAEGLSLMTEAQAVIDNSGECWWQAEVHRLRGEFLLRFSAPTAENERQAEECFHRAHTIDHDQHAKSQRTSIAISRII